MNRARDWVPVLGLLALVALFLKMPATPDFFSMFHCKTCGTSDPYLPLLGAGYFSVLIAISLLFPSFPGPKVSRGGLTWATLLAVALTYIDMPGWCADCLIGHACNILIWVVWVFVSPGDHKPSTATIKERLCLTMFSAISVVSLFCCLNLTFMTYGFKGSHSSAGTTLQPGEAAPTFAAKTKASRSIANTDARQNTGLVINFVSKDCNYCKEQIPIVESVANQLVKGPYRFINVCPELSPELMQRSPTVEWVEDRNGTLRQLFHVSGFPIMFVIGNDGKIAEIFAGVQEQFKSLLLTSLIKRQ